MPDNVLSYWNLTDEPFENAVTDKYFYESPTHQEALARLNYLANKNTGSIGILSGAIGTGKTLTRNVFVKRVDRKKFFPVVFENSDFSFEEILYESIAGFMPSYFPKDIKGISPKYIFYRDFKNNLLQTIEKKGLKLILIFDEAQRIKSDILTELKGLTNICQRGVYSVLLIFIGQSEVIGKLGAIAEIKQRVGISYHFENLSREETVNYIRYRLKVAGCLHDNFFAEDALKEIYQITKGNPREINRLCKLSLEFAAGIKKSSIDKILLNAIDEDMKKSIENAPIKSGV